MRRLVTLDDADLARRLSDALLADGIETDLRDDDPEAELEVWVRDDADLDAARDLSDRFLADPDAWVSTAKEGARARREREAEERRWRARVARTQASIHGAGARPVVTTLIGAAAAIVTLASRFGADRALTDLLVLTRYPARAGLVDVSHGEIWRLWTPALLHFDVLHLAFNLWMWFAFGRMVEERKGSRFFLGLVLVADTGGFVAQWLWTLLSSPSSFAYAGGLSGMLYALFGYVWLKGRLDPTEEMQLHPQTTMILAGWLVLGFTGLLGVANGAHVGGLVVGLLWALGDMALFRIRRRLDDR